MLCTSKSVGLILISQERGVLTKRTIIAAISVQNLPPDQPFYILVGNFTSKRQYLSKRMRIVTVSEAPKFIFDHSQKDDPTAATLNENQQTALSAGSTECNTACRLLAPPDFEVWYELLY